MTIVTTDIYSFIYTTLMQQIEASVPGIKTIDIYDSQPLFERDEESYDLPALFIEFKPVQWQQRGGGSRRAPMQMDMHIEVNREGLESAASTPDPQRVDGLAYLQLLAQVRTALNGFNSSYGNLLSFSSLTNTADALNINAGVTRVDVLSWQTSVVDNTAVAATSVIPVAGQTITVEGNA